MIINDKSLPYHLSRAFLAEFEEEIAGGVIGGLVPDQHSLPGGFPDHFAPLLELESFVAGYWAIIGLAVYPEFRNRGIARLLIRFAIQQATSLSAKGLSLVVEDTNAAALALYRNHGFREREARPWISFVNRSGPANWLLMTSRFDFAARRGTETTGKMSDTVRWGALSPPATTALGLQSD